MLSSVWLSMQCCIIFVWCVYLYLPRKCFVAVVLSSNEQYNFALWNIVNPQHKTNNCSLESSFPSVNTSALCCIYNCSYSDRVLVTASIYLRWDFTPLHEAAQKGRTQVCSLLVCWIVAGYILIVDNYIYLSTILLIKKCMECYMRF